ncbi:hypothetical protein [Malaciobacter molluscorum]|nr:hypothetical protein [Malaciobacter molluscorum]
MSEARAKKGVSRLSRRGNHNYEYRGSCLFPPRENLSSDSILIKEYKMKLIKSLITISLLCVGVASYGNTQIPSNYYNKLDYQVETARQTSKLYINISNLHNLIEKIRKTEKTLSALKTKDIKELWTDKSLLINNDKFIRMNTVNRVQLADEISSNYSELLKKSLTNQLQRINTIMKKLELEIEKLNLDSVDNMNKYNELDKQFDSIYIDNTKGKR